MSKQKYDTNTEVIINDEKFVLESKEGEQLIKELQSQKKLISSSDIYQMIKVLSKGKKKKSPEVYGDIQELWDMHDFVEEMEKEAAGKDGKYEAIVDALDILLAGHAYGGAVVLAKWAESEGYNLKGDNNGR
jgi:predicted nucleic-acid-binding protein